MRILSIALVAMLIAAPSQAKTKRDFDRFTDITVGQPKEKVAELMGQPENTELNGDREAWQFCARDGGANRFVGVFFHSGIVAKTVTYSRLWAGGCTAQFRPVDWTDETIHKAKK